MNKNNYTHTLTISDVKVKDEFWSNQIRLIRENVIPYQWDALNDRIPEAAKSFCMRNYRLAGELIKRRKSGEVTPVFPTDIFETLPKDYDNLEDKFYGFVFQDSDFAKWIEAVSYSLNNYPDKELEKIADEAIDIVCAAAMDDGYLDTYYIINNPDKRFTNLRDHHEFYCFGHLCEGAVAYYEVTGKDKLLNAVKKYADLLCEKFGPADNQIHGYPGHEIAEMALIRLYNVTKEIRYLNLCKYLIDERGKRPYYFDIEHGIKDDKKSERYQYHQAHRPVRRQDEAVGHAVRAVYLYSGMADLAKLTDDDELYEACEKIFNNIIRKKMYITGGIGGTHIGEAFSFEYDLPDDTAYAETCASIGLAFFARRMLEIRPDSKYADTMERVFYNGILSGMAEDGRSFFYVNPLSVVPKACHLDERKFHVKPIRQKWFGCACCPPNIARIIGSFNTYIYTENEDILFFNLYVKSEFKRIVNQKVLNISTDANLLKDGNVKITVLADEPVRTTLALRIPYWCNNIYSLKNVTDDEIIIKDGYIYITKMFEKETVIEVDFDMKPAIVKADRRVREEIGKYAVVRGPLVYCMEEADNGANLHLIELSKKAELTVCDNDIFANKTKKIIANGRKIRLDDDINNDKKQYLDNNNRQLYYDADIEDEYEPFDITFVPYFQWANRGEGEMSVFVRGYEEA
ncbi:glycoside hydrolase family 127 protein [Falcatimonas sp. MSJ-15]|uniref:glycoside hydrolase family 127 protein n=1 Tax=Falcatimonas sp. MSJ-15 TaxID=2841515 RepID=UPI001C11BF02|nr:beta-L-arabinofuranosidase domain-containing protein [Falcatimonas sp. MSJ-15]MBU5471465.1 glycoside hydrolase family 127 protein [Falcatimonas sp. MSJ-15]